MKAKIYIYSIIVVLLSSTLFFSCTDLKEKIIDESTGKQYLVDSNLLNLVAPAYNTFSHLWYRERIWGLEEATSDELMFPTRGTDWYDGGAWQADFLHQWTPDHRDVIATWNELATGIGRANYSLNLIDGFNQTQQVKQFKAELRFIRAFFMYYYMDLYGQVPYRDYTETNFASNPKVFDRPEAFAFLVSEINSILPQLGDKGEVPYGRPDKDAAKMFLAKLYLNKEVYVGQPAWDSCLIYVNDLINSGRYGLADDYYNIFSPNNDQNATKADNEAILVAIEDDREDMGHTTEVVWVQPTFHYNQAFGGSYSPCWNGCVAPQDYFQNNWFIHTDTTTDVRWKDNRIYSQAQVYVGFNYGLQYAPDGKPLTLRDNKTPLVFTWDCPLDGAAENRGVRVLKYYPHLPTSTPQWVNNDFIIWRLADAYLMRAECNLRLSNNSDALNDVNAVRAKRNAPILTTIDLDGLLAERAMELYWEGHRRQDLIRFGKFLDARLNKPDKSPETALILPIPQSAIDAISDKSILKQNPGY